MIPTVWPKKEVIHQARKGNDIYLSIDIDLQQSLDTTLKTVLQENGGTERRENFYSLFMCMMDPYTGEVIALSGYQIGSRYSTNDLFASGIHESCQSWFQHQRSYSLYGTK